MKKLILLFLGVLLFVSCATDSAKVKTALIEYSKEQARVDKYYRYEIESIENLKVLSNHRTTYTNSGAGTKYRYQATINYKNTEKKSCINCKGNIFISDSGEYSK